MPAARTTTPSRGSQGPQAGDMTAIKKQALEREHAAEQAERAAELAMSAQVEKENLDHGIINYFDGADTPLPEPERSKEPALPYRFVRMKYGIDQMAFGREINIEVFKDDNGVEHEAKVPGAIRYFDFAEGQQYKLPIEMADYLDNKGYIFH